MRSLSSAACAAASAPLGAGVLGWPTSRWMTVSPAASFAAAAAMTSMTMKGSTAAERREILPAMRGASGCCGDGRQAEARRIDARVARPAVAADALGTGQRIDVAALPAPGVQDRPHGLAALDRGARDGA